MDTTQLNSLPQGIIEARSDLELKPLWKTSSSQSQVLLDIESKGEFQLSLPLFR